MLPAFVHTGRLLGQGVPVLNSAHPLAQSLLAAYVPAMAPGGKIVNLASPGSGDLVTRVGSPVLAPTPEGLGFNCSVSAAQKSIQSGNVPLPFQMASGMSIFVRGQWIGYAGNNNPDNLLGITYNAAPFWAWGIGVSASTGLNSSALNSICYFYDQGSSTFTNGQGATSSIANNSMFSGGFVGTAASGSRRLYLNGVAQANVTGVNAMNANHYGSLAPAIVLGNTSATRTGASILTVGYIWNRLLTAGEMRYLDANPYALLLWPSDRVSLALATLAGSGTAVTADAILAAEFLESLLGDSGVPVESLAGGSAITGNATLPLEFSAAVLRDWGAGAAQSIIRRFSHPALVGRVRRLFLPGRPGTLAIESEGRQHVDPGAPIESLGSAGNSVAGDAMSPIETLSSQRSELGAAIENAASLLVDPGAPTEGLAASLLDINGPVEALAGGITTVTDANLAIEWVTAAPSILVSLESGPERVRLLATRGRVRLLRRK